MSESCMTSKKPNLTAAERRVVEASMRWHERVFERGCTYAAARMVQAELDRACATLAKARRKDAVARS